MLARLWGDDSDILKDKTKERYGKKDHGIYAGKTDRENFNQALKMIEMETIMRLGASMYTVCSSK